VFQQGLSYNPKMLPKKPKPNQLVLNPSMDTPQWEQDLFEAIRPTETFNQNVEDNWNLKNFELNTPESEVTNPFQDEGYLFNSAAPGEIITLLVNNVESPLPTEAVVLANQEEAPEPNLFPEDEWRLWGINNNNKDEDLVSAPPLMVEGIELSATQEMEQFENEFDEQVFEAMSQEEEIKPVTVVETIATKDLLESIIQESNIPQCMDIVQKEDPDWKPEMPKFNFEKKTKLHLVEKPPKRRVGRPCRTEPIRITELPPGIRKGSHKLSNTTNVQLTPEQIDQLRYRRMRDLNNEASKKCRANRKSKLEQAEEVLAEEQVKNLELTERLGGLEEEVNRLKMWAQNYFGYVPQN